MLNKMPELSIIILNYNTKELLVNCLKSLSRVAQEVDFEVIISDNGSTDDSLKAVKVLGDLSFNLKIQENQENLGFAKGNNAAKGLCAGKYILFLNSDTEVYSGTLKQTLAYLKENPQVGVVTCKQVMPDGKIDPDSRRSFPTPWIAFTHFSYLDRIFPQSKIFAQYWYGYRSEDEVFEIDVCQGAYFLTRKSVLDGVGWFSDDYFLDGEDIDLSWKIKEKGLKIIYYPLVSILHIKKATKKTIKNHRYIRAGVDSMEIFYRKYLWRRYPLVVNWLVILGIKLIKLLRSIRRIIKL